jgi:hypothetical protein
MSHKKAQKAQKSSSLNEPDLGFMCLFVAYEG